MHEKFEINGTKIKGGCQQGRKVVTHNSKSDLPLSRALLQLNCSQVKSYVMKGEIRKKIRRFVKHGVVYLHVMDIMVYL